MMCRRIGSAIALLAACSVTCAENLSRVYIDKAKNVHVVTASGKDMKLTSDRRAEDAKLSSDGKAAAWLGLTYFAVDGHKWPTELYVYSRGRTRSIKCDGIIREYWFWKQSTHIATDCGGLHFAGIETLYDLRTMKEVDSFDQAEVPVEKRPEWSTAEKE